MMAPTRPLPPGMMTSRLTAAFRLAARTLRAGLAAALALHAALPAAAQDRGDVQPFAAELNRARAALPARLRARVQDVSLLRAEALEIPAEATLAERLFGRATFAYLDTAGRRIVLTDAGAALRARWSGPPPRRWEVVGFLETVMPPTGVLFLDLDANSDVDARRWERLRAAIVEWRGAPLAGVLGDVAVLDAFLEEAPWRALGGRVPREQLLLHELAHAVQLETSTSWRRVRAWSAVTGWREAHDGSVADGVRGAWLRERPEVLVRLLLGLPRAPSEYLPGEGDGASLYARFDPREDFAEAVRAMAYRPEELARLSPARFLAVNATGWVADLDMQRPGPLWRSAEDLGEELFRETVARGAAEILGRWAEGPEVDPAAFAAILDAHGPWIPPELAPIEATEDEAIDLPPGASRVRRRARFHVADGSVRYGPRVAVLSTIDNMLVAHAEQVGFREGFRDMLVSQSVDADFRGRVSAVKSLPVGRSRAEQIDELLAIYGRALGPEEAAQLLSAECAQLRAGGGTLLASWLDLRHGARPLDTRAAAARAAASGDSSYDAVELLNDLSKLEQQAGDLEAAARTAAAIPGLHWGAVRRVERFLALGSIDEAKAAAFSAPLPALRQRLFHQVRQAETQAEGR